MKKRGKTKGKVIPPYGKYVGRADLVFVCVAGTSGTRWHLGYIHGDSDHWVEVAPTPCDGKGCKNIVMPDSVVAILKKK